MQQYPAQLRLPTTWAQVTPQGTQPRSTGAAALHHYASQPHGCHMPHACSWGARCRGCLPVWAPPGFV